MHTVMEVVMLVLEQLLQSLVVASQDDHRMALLAVPVAGLVARTHPVAHSESSTHLPEVEQ